MNKVGLIYGWMIYVINNKVEYRIRLANSRTLIRVNLGLKEYVLCLSFLFSQISLINQSEGSL